ncbi:BTB/POZ domain-containing protein POB1 [Capsicum annuum]|uniref:BTB/POZ domain-containing protein POB1 n=1 Tax=Capsicum annuum TaxID=4072 RepID=A0A2G3ADK7_CAPAN|nr:BTB/POZ domain-containing protein POB1 [Capsicum annuum]
MNSNSATGRRFIRSGTEPDFRFAFDEKNYSDRVLMIEISPDFPELKTSHEECFSIVVDWARKLKRRREEINRRGNDNVDVVMQFGKKKVSCNLLEKDNGLADDEREEAVGMLEESPSGIAMATNLPGTYSSMNMDSSNPLRVRTLHISSAILAAKSQFFYKLFVGMKESQQQHVTIQIHVSAEETAVMDLLKFIYSNALSATTPTGVFDVLMAADKFEVVSCMRYCSFLLQNLHMTTDSALLYLNLPSNILMADDVQLLTNAAKKFLAARFVDITKFQEEVFSLPLLGIEAVLSSDDLQIDSEDAVYDIALKWARKHYPKLEERWEVWSSHLCHLIRFPFMTERKLRKVLMCSDFDPELASKLVIEALFYKDEAPYCQGSIAAEAGNALHHCYVQRAYKYRPVKALHFETPRQQCIIYLDLKRDECVRLFPVGRVYTQTFHLGGRGFFLSARCSMDQQNGSHCFGLFLRMQEKGSESFAVDYEFAARISPDEKYVRKHKGDYIFTRGMKVGCRNLFGVDWTTFLDRDSVYFINGILYLRAEVTVRQ